MFALMMSAKRSSIPMSFLLSFGPVLSIRARRGRYPRVRAWLGWSRPLGRIRRQRMPRRVRPPKRARAQRNGGRSRGGVAACGASGHTFSQAPRLPHAELLKRGLRTLLELAVALFLFAPSAEDAHPTYTSAGTSTMDAHKRACEVGILRHDGLAGIRKRLREYSLPKWKGSDNICRGFRLAHRSPRRPDGRHLMPMAKPQSKPPSPSSQNTSRKCPSSENSLS